MNNSVLILIPIRFLQQMRDFSFGNTKLNRIPGARDFSHEKRFHYTYIPIAQTLVLLVADGFITLPKTHLRRGSV